MRKYWLFFVLLATLLLAACGGKAPASPSANSNVDLPDGPPMACTMFNLFPDPRDPAEVKLAEVSNKDWSRGADKPRMLIVEYSDFQCPYCSLAGRMLKEFETAHPDEVQVVFRHFPLNIHDKALIAAQAAEAAGAQDKFWELHDALFTETNWETWNAQTVEQFEGWLTEQVKSLGLDVERFNRDLKSDAVVKKVEAAYQSAVEMGLQGTPSMYIFLDGELIFTPEDQVPYDPATLGMILDLQEMSDRQFTECPPTIVDPAKEYTALIKTNKGDIEVKLYADKAPLAVNSFVVLAKTGWYDGVTFHRVLQDFVAQTGDPSGSGYGGPGYQFASEIDSGLKFDREGLLGMANGGPDTNGSQFFITYGALPNLDGGYTIFGEVTQGMDVARSLTLRNPAEAQAGVELPEGDKIISITIEEK